MGEFHSPLCRKAWLGLIYIIVFTVKSRKYVFKYFGAATPFRVSFDCLWEAAKTDAKMMELQYRPNAIRWIYNTVGGDLTTRKKGVKTLRYFVKYVIKRSDKKTWQCVEKI